jgi:hypothetical protein
MDYAALKAEIEANPACSPHAHTNDMPRISSADVSVKDQAIADIINAETVEVMVSIPVEEVFDALFTSGDYLSIKQAQMGGNPVAAMCFAVLDDTKRIGPGRVNLELPGTKGLLDQLQSASLLTQGGRDALTARATVIKRASEIKYGRPVSGADASRALRGPWGNE